MRLIELEKQTIHDVLAFTNLSATEIDLVFAAVVEAPIDLFLKYYIMWYWLLSLLAHVVFTLVMRHNLIQTIWWRGEDPISK